VRDSFFNQLRGKDMAIFFDTVTQNIDSMDTRGSQAENIYYPQEEKNKKLISLNLSTSDEIKIYLKNQTLDEVVFLRHIKGTTYPIWKLPVDKKTLSGFKWYGKKRPREKYQPGEFDRIVKVNDYFPSVYPNRLNMLDYNQVSIPKQLPLFLPPTALTPPVIPSPSPTP
jgi:hypothetical protein